MNQISLKQIEAFTQVAALGSFRRAAMVLNTTQPNISARISALEARLGKRIMERDAGSVRLTRAGEDLLAKARLVVSAVDDFLVTADNPNLFDGTLRLGMTETIAHSWVGEFLMLFSSKFPNVVTELLVDLSANLSIALDENAIDLAFQSWPFENTSSGQLEMGNYPLIWVASNKSSLGNGHLTLDAIIQYPILTHSKKTLPYQQLEKHLSEAVKPANLVPSSSLATCLRMTVQNIGIACLPLAMVKDDLDAGNLKLLSYDWVPDPLQFEARFHLKNAPHFVLEAAKIGAEISTRSLEK